MTNIQQKSKKESKQRSLPKRFVVGEYRTKAKRSKAGIGLYVIDEIPKGACIIEYVGRRISNEEEYTINSKYLFEINSRHTIDGKPGINKAGYINHSCRPNAEPEIHSSRVFIMSKRKIKTGEEITYDYGKEYWKEYIKPHGCKCEKCLEKSN